MVRRRDGIFELLQALNFERLTLNSSPRDETSPDDVGGSELDC
jgi:hypothetical protein